MSAAELRDYYFDRETGDFVGVDGELAEDVPTRMLVVRHVSRERAEDVALESLAALNEGEG